MRIVCEKCSSAFAVDDKVVTAKGVRARCPRCKNIQVVKKASSPTLEPSPFLADVPAAVPPPLGAPSSSPSSAFLFDLGMPAPPPRAPVALEDAVPPSSPFGPSGHDFSSGAPSATKSRSPFESSPPARDAFAETPDDPVTEVKMAKCRTCGKVMSDPFDQALGVCDTCRNNSPELSEPLVIQSAEVPPEVARSSPSQFPKPEGRFGRQFESPAPALAPTSASRSQKLWLFVVGGLLVVGVAGVVLVRKPWVAEPPPLVVKKPASKEQPGDAILQQWKLKYPDLQGASLDALLDDGEKLLQRDTTAGYVEAEEAFEQALLLDPSSARAISGWALALAFGRAGRLDDATFGAAETMLLRAEKESGDEGVFVAHAHLMIANNGNSNDVRMLAERGLSSSNAKSKAMAALAVGQSYLNKNQTQASENFALALELDPTLKRAFFFQAQLAVSLGQYAEAASAFEHRLELDADQWDAAEGLARLLVEVGEVSRAKKVLESAKAASPRANRPKITWAVLTYQHLGDKAAAAAELNSVLAGAELSKSERVEALIHLGTIQRLSGDLDQAGATLELALNAGTDTTGANLQRFLIAIDKGVASSARLEFEGLQGRLNDKHQEGVLEGRLLLVEGKFEEALAVLTAAAEDPRRVDAIFLAGAAAAKAKKVGKAWEFCLRRGLKADPHSRPVPALTGLFVRPADTLKGAVGAYAGLTQGNDEDPSAFLCEGLVAWFSEDVSTAEKNFLKVGSIDGRDANALAYRSLAALQRKDFPGASKLANRALDASKTNALAWLSQAEALSAQHKLDQAKISAKQAEKFGPQLLAARVIVGEVEAIQKNEAEARRALTSVLLIDPLYSNAKKALFNHQL
jgi:predicted Zn finger-like uncharacterized protein